MARTSSPASTPPARPVNELAPCGSPMDALGAALVGIGFNLGLALVSTAIASGVARMGSPQTPAERVRALRRGIEVGAAIQGVAALGTGLYVAERHPHFGGIATYSGLTALGLTGLAALAPDAAFEQTPSPVGGGATPPPIVTPFSPGRALSGVLQPLNGLPVPRVRAAQTATGTCAGQCSRG